MEFLAVVQESFFRA